MIVQLLSRYLCIDNTNQQNTTINVYTLFVTTISVVTFYVLYLSWKSKIERYGNPVYIWKDCYREEFYRP